MARVKQKQVYKNKAKTIKATKFTDTKTGTSKVIFERLKPKK